MFMRDDDTCPKERPGVACLNCRGEWVNHVGWQCIPTKYRDAQGFTIGERSKLPSTHCYSTPDMWVQTPCAPVSVKTTTCPDGKFCKGCHQFFPMAVANRKSGELVCWSCRQGYVPKEW